MGVIRKLKGNRERQERRETGRLRGNEKPRKEI